MYLEQLQRQDSRPRGRTARQALLSGKVSGAGRAGAAGIAAGARPENVSGQRYRPRLHGEEARLLDVDRYFDGGVYGALDDYKSFSKKILIQRLIASSEFRGDEFLGFGDGYVEIENVKEVGGVAVGVATAEPECLQRRRMEAEALGGVGADFIVPNYLCHDELLAYSVSRMSSVTSKYRAVRPLAGCWSSLSPSA